MRKQGKGSRHTCQSGGGVSSPADKSSVRSQSAVAPTATNLANIRSRRFPRSPYLTNDHQQRRDLQQSGKASLKSAQCRFESGWGH